ncbi:hypothetical protein N510_002242 [Firmicutes bacterium ASF500]|nr:hypothetical protein N510_002242 [Firmicutes bacterium ASF500]
MLLKLLKYDFRAMWKQFSLIWGAALALALVNRFVLFRDTDNAILSEDGLFMLAFVAVIVAMFVIAVIFVVNRFSKGLLGNEGYLMHTLPVRPWQLVTSKLICGVVTWVGCGVVAFISPVLMLPLNLPDLLQFPFWSDIFRGIMKHPDMLVLMAEFCMVFLSFIVLLVASMYLAMAVGHLFSRHRRLISIASFIGLYVLVGNVYDQVFSYRIVRALTNAASVNAYGSMLVAIAIMLIPAIVFLAVTCWILEHKLNLE